MSGSTITGTIFVGVTLGADGDNDQLSLTAMGGIDPTDSGLDGVYAVAATIVNEGNISGRSGGDNGGTGVSIQGGSLKNSGTIAGGSSSYNGTIGTGGAGLELSGATVLNSGLIAGGVGGTAGFISDGSNSGAGILQSSGTMTNIGTISGGAAHPRDPISMNGNSYYIVSAAGVGANFTGGSFLNLGTIVGGYGGGSGAAIGGGSFTNGGTVVGGVEADGVSLSAGTLTNNGMIAGGQPYASAIVTSGFDGIYQSGGTLVNNGIISGSDAMAFVNEGETDFTAGYGVEATNGMIFNFGTISAGKGGVNNTGFEANSDVGVVLDTATLVTDGLIAGGIDEFGDQDDAVALRSSLAVIILEPGAAFTGDVVGFGRSLIQLDSGTTETAGTLDMGGSFSGFGTVAFATGADWRVAGTTNELAAGQTINGFTSQDTIFLEGYVATSHTYTAGIGLVISGGATNETIDITGDLSTSSFIVTAASGQTEVELLCYLRGTYILTPVGEVEVEKLAIGDPVVTRFGGYRKIKWIGRQSFARKFIQKNRAQIPVCITAGAFGECLPKRDLYVSPGHSMLLQNILVLASSLVNGVTITQSNCPDEVHYYQVELETHDCVQAEGCWSETFCDYGDLRDKFHNAGDFWRLYPEHANPSEHLMCAPRYESGPALNAVLSPIVARAAAQVRFGPLRGFVDEVQPSGLIRGWAFDIANPDLPVLLELQRGNRVVAGLLACDYRPDLAAAGFGRGRCAFTYQGPKIARKSLSDIRVHRLGDRHELILSPDRLTSTMSYIARRKRA